MKACTKCGVVKDFDDFYRNPQQKSGRDPSCKECKRAYHAENYRKHREKILAGNKKWQRANKDKVRELAKRLAKRHRGRASAYSKRWRQKNPAALRAYVALQRARRKKATPSWVSKSELAYFYKLAVSRTKEWGIKYSVDHIVPLSSPIVCGLHVPANLRVMNAQLNAKKSNREWPNMPGDPY